MEGSPEHQVTVDPPPFPLPYNQEERSWDALSEELAEDLRTGGKRPPDDRK